MMSWQNSYIPYTGSFITTVADFATKILKDPVSYIFDHYMVLRHYIPAHGRLPWGPGLGHRLLNGVRELGVQRLRELEHEDGGHQAEAAKGDEGDEAGHLGEDQLPQEQHLG